MNKMICKNCGTIINDESSRFLPELRRTARGPGAGARLPERRLSAAPCLSAAVLPAAGAGGSRRMPVGRARIPDPTCGTDPVSGLANRTAQYGQGLWGRRACRRDYLGGILGPVGSPVRSGFYHGALLYGDGAGRRIVLKTDRHRSKQSESVHLLPVSDHRMGFPVRLREETENVLCKMWR